MVTLAVAQCHAWDGATNADGVSYLDLATRYAHGEWSALANGYWSPLYPMLLGAAQRLDVLLPGGPHREMAVVFAVNVALFGAVIVSLARLARIVLLPAPPNAPTTVVVLRLVTAAALGVWLLIRLIGATTVTPDALLAALLFLASAELASAARGGADDARDLRLGVLLAAGCWTKAVFFPVAVVALVAYALALGQASRRRAVPRALVAFVVFALPLVLVQSWTQGRPSFGETGRLNYRWYVGGAAHAAPVMEPVEATRLRVAPAPVALFDAGNAVLFAGDVAGSFPYWYDPARYEPPGIGAVTAVAQWRILAFNSHWLRATAGALLLFALVAAVAALARAPAQWRLLWFVAPAVATLALYLLTHPEGRMGGAALACVLLAMIGVTAIGPRGHRPAAIVAECVALAVVCILALGRASNRMAGAPTTALADAEALPRAIHEAGVMPGDAVAVVGSPFGARWAHETGARIVVVVTPTQPLDAAMLAAVARESAARGYPLKATLFRETEPVRAGGALPLPGGWRMVR